ncbi:MAG: LarC family nickel insertion protein [Bacteroidota bacterium]|nr:LarC family nickel insertion protein [Bacteroidota bacterium]
MNIAYFDTFAGISGDMTLGAFIHAGVPLEHLRIELTKLGVSGYSLHSRIIERSAISAVKIDVETEDEDRHEHHHNHPQPHSHRSLADILSLIKSSGLTARIQSRAERIFIVIGEAEAKIHNTTIDKIHFHEVGAVDSIVDIVGACICLEYFDIEKLYSSPVRIGNGGFVNTQHGTMPIPTPATVEILKGYPTIPTEIPH